MKNKPILISIDFDSETALTLLRTPGAKVCATITRVDARNLSLSAFLDRAAETLESNQYFFGASPALDYAPDQSPALDQLQTDFFHVPEIIERAAFAVAGFAIGFCGGYMLPEYLTVLF